MRGELRAISPFLRSCVVALISQGINLQQTVANAVGDTLLQDTINETALILLRAYHDDFRKMHLGASHHPSSFSSVRRKLPVLAASSSLSSSSREKTAPSPRGSKTEGDVGYESEFPLQRRMAEMGRLMHEVERVVTHAASHHEKSTSVLCLTERLVRGLQGGRVTSCKSGKDRTSMAITAEQVEPRPVYSKRQ